MDWINNVLSNDQAGISVIIAVFGLGILSVFGCACNYAVIGTIAGYTGTISSTGNKKDIILNSLFFLIGNVLAMTAIGILIVFVGKFIISSLGSYWKIGTGILSILFGVYILDILPFKIPGISVNLQNNRSGISGAILFGFVIGGVTSLSNLCCNPVFPVLMTFSFVKGSILWGLFMLFSYSLGYGLTFAAIMLGLGLGFGKISNIMAKFNVVLKYAGGIALIIFGFYYLLTF